MSHATPPETAALIERAYRYHPRGRLDIEPGYESLPEVRARRTAQEQARREVGAWAALLSAARATWPTAGVMDWSRLELDTARHLRIQLAAPQSQRHLVAWASILAPVALVYEAQAERGRPAHRPTHVDTPRRDDCERLEALLAAHGWAPLARDVAALPLPDLAVGNRLPGHATLADALFSDHRW